VALRVRCLLRFQPSYAADHALNLSLRNETVPSQFSFPTMIIPDTGEKSSFKSPHRDEDQVRPTLNFHPINPHSTDYAAQSPPPYSPLPQGSSATQPSNLPPDLAPTNYIHVKERDHSVKRKILLDLNVPRPPASALPLGAQGEDTPHLMLDSHNGSVSGEIWLLRTNFEPTTTAHQKPAQERAHLHFHSHNGAVKAQVVRRRGEKQSTPCPY